MGILMSTSSSEYEREESRWLREEQRWLREEQRWIREERRWEAERESLLNEIKALKLQIEDLRHEGANNSVSNVSNLLHVLKKEVSQIAESGSSVAPLVVEAAAAAVEEAEEVVVVKEVIKTVEEVKEKEITKKRTTLRVGSEGDQVRLLQEALQKLGFYCGEEDDEFSSFSTCTKTAVKTWQVFLVSEVELNIYLEIDDFDGSLILMAAGDTFRAAPSDQLGIWTERTGCEIVLPEKEKAKASSVLSQAVKKGKEQSFDIVLCDTSGRKTFC
ncbi:hypothetical protein L1887_14585 [Cichorium endivia]|nr:hypothetical protein L1887_14585 [Cichorium endivia]